MSALAAGASLLGSALQYSNAEQNRDQQLHMARNKYQYGVQDLRKAGLNPILAAGGLTGTGPQGSSMGNIENPVSSALMAKKLNAETDNIAAQTEFIKNKTATTDPIASIMQLLENWIDKPSKDVGGAGPGAWEKFKDFLKSHKGSSAKDKLKKSRGSSGNNLINSAKKFLNRGGSRDVEAYGFKE